MVAVEGERERALMMEESMVDGMMERSADGRGSR